MKIPCISKRVSVLFQMKGYGTFEKWRPLRVIVDLIQKDQISIPNDTLNKFEKIFKEVNRIIA